MRPSKFCEGHSGTAPSKGSRYSSRGGGGGGGFLGCNGSNCQISRSSNGMNHRVLVFHHTDFRWEILD
jgi:hypothetical protein